MVGRLPDSAQIVFSQTLGNVYANAQQHVDANHSFSEAFQKELTDVLIPPRVDTRLDKIIDAIWNKFERFNESHPRLINAVVITSGICLITGLVGPMFFFYRR